MSHVCVEWNRLDGNVVTVRGSLISPQGTLGGIDWVKGRSISVSYIYIYILSTCFFPC